MNSVAASVLPPTATQNLSPAQEIAAKLFLVTAESSSLQVWPPSVERNRTPREPPAMQARPVAQPTPMTKLTGDCTGRVGDQLAPPSEVARVLPGSPTAKHVVVDGQLMATRKSPDTPVASAVQVRPPSFETAASPVVPVA